MGNSCTQFFLFSTGCGNKTTIQDTVNLFQGVVANALSSAVTNKIMTAQLAQNMSITIGPYALVQCGSFDVSQAIQGTYQVYSQIDATQYSNMMNQLNATILQQITQSSSSIQGFLAAASHNLTSQQIADSLTSSIESAVTLNVVNNLVNSFDFTQNQNIVINGTLIVPGACNYNQSLFVNLFVSDNVTLMQNAVMSNDIMTNMQQLLNNSSSSTSEGPFDSYANTSNASVQWLIIIAVIIVFGGILTLMGIYISKSGKENKKLKKCREAMIAAGLSPDAPSATATGSNPPPASTTPSAASQPQAF